MSVQNQLGYRGFPCPVGSIQHYAGQTAPPTYLLCDGASLERDEYVELFNCLGTSFGAVDALHFNIPDLITFPYMLGGVAVNTTPSAGSFFPTTTTLTSNQIPSIGSGSLPLTSWNLSVAGGVGGNNQWFVNTNSVQSVQLTQEDYIKSDSSDITSFSGTCSGGDIGYVPPAQTAIAISSTFTPTSLELIPIIKAWYSLTPTPDYNPNTTAPAQVPPESIYIFPNFNPALAGFVI